jgi:hypothetical protein
MIASPYLSGTKMGRMLSFIRAYKRRIVSSLVFAYAAFLLIHPDEEGRAFDLIFFAVLVMLIGSQLLASASFLGNPGAPGLQPSSARSG